MRNRALVLATVLAAGPGLCRAEDVPPTSAPASAPSQEISPAATRPVDPTPILPPLTTQPAGRAGTLSTQPSVRVARFKFTGIVNRKKINEADLQQIVRPFVGRDLSIEGLEEARVAVTKFLVEKGYINSGAILPDQTVEDGTITLQIVEGKLTDVKVTGTKQLRPSFVASRLARAGRTPMDIISVKDELELLRQDPLLKSIQAELRPGAQPGEAVLDVAVNEANPIQLGMTFSNRRPPSVGSTALDVTFSDKDLTGNGDLLYVRYDAVNGPLSDLQLAGADDFSISYTIPITAADTTLAFDFTRTDSVVVETPFEDLSINSKSNSYAVTIRQPLYRRPTFEPATATSKDKPAVDFAVFGSFAYREDETSLLGRPFEFSPGSDNGESRVVALRFGQELVTRSQDDALSLRSTFSFGIPAFAATEHGRDIPDGQFIAWLGQAQYVRRLPSRKWLPDETQFVLRGAVQFSNSPLLPLEQFAVGGFDTVRGYRENFLVRDEGFSVGAELRLPVIKGKGGDAMLTAVPFVDFGHASDLSGQFGSTDISSVGVGLVLTPDPHVTAQLFYGYALINRGSSRQDPQDVGIQFNVSLFAF